MIGAQYYQRAEEIQGSLKPGMTRSQVYRELDRFWPYWYTVGQFDSNPTLCDRDYPFDAFKEVAEFGGPFGLRPGAVKVYLCFDESGRLVFLP